MLVLHTKSGQEWVGLTRENPDPEDNRMVFVISQKGPLLCRQARSKCSSFRSQNLNIRKPVELVNYKYEAKYHNA